nr:alkaline phosphatase D family protein [Angustibacter aerolatus]
MGNQTMLAQTDRLVGRAENYDLDTWDGARVQRRRLLETVGRAGVDGFVVLSGDWHATWGCDLRPDFDDERSPVVGSELVATSISSSGDPDVDRFLDFYRPIQRESPHWRFLDNQRGYLRVDVGPDVLRATLRAATTVVTRDGRVEDSAHLVVERDRPGVHVESYRRVAVHHRRPPVGPAGPLKPAGLPRPGGELTARTSLR